MRFNLIFILLIVLAAIMGMNSENVLATVTTGSPDLCSADEAYRKGQEGETKPDNCSIGKASVVHENWVKGFSERQEKLKADSSGPVSEAQTN